jgi:hypothetical protein
MSTLATKNMAAKMKKGGKVMLPKKASTRMGIAKGGAKSNKKRARLEDMGKM